MEKDFFKDRTDDTKSRNAIKRGDRVLICEKYMQPFAETVGQLTEGVIVDVLTARNHPRGIKVKIQQDNDRIAIGRVVYRIENGIIQRKNNKV
ncbi:MAG: DUF2196 domain-containing protein [Erysipelotrichaceae bacterium]